MDIASSFTWKFENWWLLYCALWKQAKHIDVLNPLIRIISFRSSKIRNFSTVCKFRHVGRKFIEFHFTPITPVSQWGRQKVGTIMCLAKSVRNCQVSTTRNWSIKKSKMSLWSSKTCAFYVYSFQGLFILSLVSCVKHQSYNQIHTQPHIIYNHSLSLIGELLPVIN